MILSSKVFQRLLNYSFDTIFRGETLTALQQKSQKRISRHKCCLFTISRAHVSTHRGNGGNEVT